MDKGLIKATKSHKSAVINIIQLDKQAGNIMDKCLLEQKTVETVSKWSMSLQ